MARLAYRDNSTLSLFGPDLIDEPPSDESESTVEVSFPPEFDEEQTAESTFTNIDEADPGQACLFGEHELQAVEPIAEPIQSIYVHFEDLADLEAFGRLIGQPVTTQTRLIKFPVDKNYFKTWMANNGA
jgi:hypothetical protein